MTTISESHARSLAFDLLIAMRADPEAARVVAGHLVDANLAGHDSHGLIRLPQYFKQVQEGEIRTDQRPVVVRETPTTALIDGNWTWGPFAAAYATDLAVARARKQGVSCVSLRNAAHVGRVGVYPRRAAEEGLLAQVWCNSVGSARVAPWGGTEARLATNPLAAAVPTSGRPLVVDATTSAVAEGKVRLARNSGSAVPLGWILDAEGKPTTNPADLYAGGTILPLGGPMGYKGFGLSVAVDVFAGVLSGAGCGRMPGVGNGNAMTMVAIDPGAFLDPEEFRRRVDEYCAYLRHTPTQPGVEEILLPGEPEERSAAHRRRAGIPVDDGTWGQIVDLGRVLNVGVSDRSQ
jgi:uncharacterized oxidoreductase